MNSEMQGNRNHRINADEIITLCNNIIMTIMKRYGVLEINPREAAIDVVELFRSKDNAFAFANFYRRKRKDRYITVRKFVCDSETGRILSDSKTDYDAEEYLSSDDEN